MKRFDGWVLNCIVLCRCWTCSVC